MGNYYKNFLEKLKASNLRNKHLFYRPTCWTFPAGTGSRATTSSVWLSSSSASSPSPASPRDSAPWWQTSSPWGPGSRAMTWRSGRTSTFRAPGVRCTLRPSHQPSQGWPSPRPQSKYLSHGLTATEPLSLLQALLCQTEAAAAGPGGQAGWRRGRQDLNQPQGNKNTRKHRRILHCSVSGGSQTVSFEL